MTFRFLGTGTSVGVPQIGCSCPVCTSSDPRDRRRRCGAYVSAPGGSFLIDTPPELREACIDYGISKVDAVLLTHAHMDHIAGFDDIRRFNTLNGERVACDPSAPGANGRTFRIIGRPISCWALPETIEQMHRIFPYIGVRGGENGLFRPQVEFRDSTAPFSVCGVDVAAFRVSHGFPCCGYRLRDPTGGGTIGYVSDCHEISDDAVALLRGVDALVINCLRLRDHPTHLTLERSLGYIGRIAPRRAYLTHMCHDCLHSELLEMLPEGVEPAYDGLVLDLDR